MTYPACAALGGFLGALFAATLGPAFLPGTGLSGAGWVGLGCVGGVVTGLLAAAVAGHRDETAPPGRAARDG